MRSRGTVNRSSSVERRTRRWNAWASPRACFTIARMGWFASRHAGAVVVELLSVACSWAACTPAKVPASAAQAPRASTPAAVVAGPTVPSPPITSAVAAGSLPRLEQIWSQSGLGRFDGVVRDRVYYTVANDGRSLNAVDTASGKRLWQTSLTEPVKDWLQARIVGNGVLLVYQRPEADDAKTVVARISIPDRRLSWSKTVACWGAAVRNAGPRFYLLCGGRDGGHKTEVVHLDSSTGSELVRAPLATSVEVTTGGELCGFSYSEHTMWCARPVVGRLETLWSEPTLVAAREVRLQGLPRAPRPRRRPRRRARLRVPQARPALRNEADRNSLA
jgi:hypothetical protein